MDSSMPLSELNDYCSLLLGKPVAKKDIQLNANLCKKKTEEQNLFSNEKTQNIKNKKIKKISKEEKLESKKLHNETNIEKVTEDGFKIITEIPPDDSDISDAFDSDIDEEYFTDTQNPQCNKSYDKLETSANKTNFTEDGFKIISDIPSDDSDVSDAFECDLDESEWMDEVEYRKNIKNGDSSSEKVKIYKIQQELNNVTDDHSLEDIHLQNIKRPLLKLIDDFGMKNQLIQHENSVSLVKSKCVSKPKKSPIKNIKIFDYSNSRGKKKKTETLNREETKNSQPNEIDAQTYFKKARYDVFKMGLSGFDKEKQKNAKIEMAIRLGAKPPPKTVKNYKNLISEMKREKLQKRTQEEENRELGIKTKKEKPQPTKKTLNIVPLAGKFKGGVLTLSKKDIAKIKHSK